MTPDDEMNALIKAAVELTGKEDPRWEMIAARLLYHQFKLNLHQEEEKRGIKNLYDKIRYLVDENLYGSYILEHYTKEDILRCAEFMNEDRNSLYTYAGLDLLLSRSPSNPVFDVLLRYIRDGFKTLLVHARVRNIAIRYSSFLYCSCTFG